MTKIGDESYSPEMVFIFGTVFVVRHNRKKNALEILWTLQKDRAKKNIWTPPGGEWLVPKKTKKSKFTEISETGIREVKEEIGVDVQLMGCGPFWECIVLNGYPDYHGQITIKKEQVKGTLTSSYFKNGAHTMLLYYLAIIRKGKPRCMKQPQEKDNGIKNWKWLTFNDSFSALKKGKMKTYPSIIEATNRLHWLLVKEINPFFNIYK